MKPTIKLAIAAAAVALVALSGCTSPEPAPGPSTGAGPTAFAAPDGSGSTCTKAAPCTLAVAVTAAGGDGSVALLDGDFGDVSLGAGSLAASGTVVIEPAKGAKPTFGKISIDQAHTTWRHLDVTGGIYLDTGATGTTLDRIHLNGSGVFVHAKDVTIKRSVIENGTSIDGIQVSGAERLLVEDSIVRGFGQGADSDVHSDCVQLFDSSDITLRGNYLGGCDNAALIFSPGSGHGIKNVVIEGNYLQGCVVKSDRCSRGTALDLRETTTADVTVRNNTMLNGSVMVDALPGLVFDRNIVGYASNCDMPMTNSIVVAWNKGTCPKPTAVGKDGNRVGEVTVADESGGDLSITNASDATIQPSGGKPAGSGYGGATLDADQAGAGG